MRLRSGTQTRSRPRYSYQQLMRKYPLFDFPVPRRHRLRDNATKSVSVRPYRRRLPLQRV